MQKFIDLVLDTIKSVSDDLSKRMETLEHREVVHGKDGQVGPVGPMGPQGEKGLDGIGLSGENGADGVGIKSLSLWPSGHLIVDLTDGQSIDAGALPVKEGLAGKDADMSAVHALKSDVASLRDDFKFHVEAKQHPTPEDVSALLDPLVAKAISTLPVPRDGIDGKDGSVVSVEDIRPLVLAEVAKAVASVPPAKDGHDGLPGKDAVFDQKAFDAILARMTGLETKVAALPVDLAPDDLEQQFAGLLKKELDAIAPPVRFQKRVIRDATGRVDRVVEEPVAS